MVHFLSNHKDTSFVELFTGSEVTHIPHPYIDPKLSENDVWDKYGNVIQQAAEADTLVINGDYFLVALILKERLKAKKVTGFIAMQKFNEPSNEIDSEGNIIHKNILRPMQIRWVS